MMNEIANELISLVESSTEYLKKIDESIVSVKPDPAKWSIQEILGHLIDSAANNHQRFIRAQEVDTLIFPKYEQDHWVRVQEYNESSWTDLIQLWRLYNLHLARVIARLPKEKLAMECKIGPYEPVSLEYIAKDYVVHLKHHLKQIEEKSAV